MTIEHSKIRVLMVDSEETWRGGEAQVELLMRGLLDMGFHVSLAAAPDAVIVNKAKAIGVDCLPVPIAGGMDLAAAWNLRGYLQRFGFDIIHCHSSHAHSVALMANSAYGLTGQTVRTGRPRLVVSRRVDFPVGRNGLSALKYRHGVDVFLAISEGVRDVLIMGGVKPEKIVMVPSGIDLQKFNGVGETGYLRTEFGLDDRTRVIGNVAALAPHKSQVDFIKAAKLILEKTPNAKFLIVGEGELRGELEASINGSGLADRVIMTGFRRDVLEILSIFDCFVLSSYLEGLCTSIMDAQALGIPVVATNTGGVPDLVTDMETGLLVPPRRPDAIAGAVMRMLGDEELRESCVRRAGEKARSYDFRNMVQKTADVYERILAVPEKTV